MVDVRHELRNVAIAMHAERLEAILIGNAGAAVHGANITTNDVDFYVRSTPRNKQKIVTVGKRLGATIWMPYYPTSRMLQLQGPVMPVEFVFSAHGIKSFESLRKRAERIEFDGGEWSLLVADLGDIVKSKEAAGRPKDLAALPVLKQTLELINAEKEAAKRADEAERAQGLGRAAHRKRTR